MLRISALIAVLAFLGTTTTAISAQPPGQASQRCYNAEKCASICNSKGLRQCEFWCKRQASTLPACK
jgi:hypothetical protein